MHNIFRSLRHSNDVTTSFEITIYFYKKFETFVVKEYFWTSVCLMFLALLAEYFYQHRHEYEVSPHEENNTQVSPLYFDGPTSNDLFNRRYYAKLLLEKIYASFCKNKASVKHSFVIHIGEHYGQGKTSFLMMFDEEVSKRGHKVISINFEPWLCDTETVLSMNFLILSELRLESIFPNLMDLSNNMLSCYCQLSSMREKAFP